MGIRFLNFVLTVTAFLCILHGKLAQMYIVQSIYANEGNTKFAVLPTMKVVTRSFIDCARKCTNVDNCVAANYLESKKECYLSNRICDSTELSPEWQFLRLRSRKFNHF